MKDWNDFSAPWVAFSPLSLMQNYWTLWADWQQSLLNNWLSGSTALWQQGVDAASEDMAGQPNPWAGFMGGVPGALPGLFNPANLDLANFVPHVEARITPLETTGALAGAKDASRVSMRLSLPGMGGQAETVFVEAVVARAPTAEVDKLGAASKALLDKKP